MPAAPCTTPEPTINLVTRLRARNPLPEGTLPVAVGLVISGVATYGFFAVASRALDPASYSTLGVLWGLLFAVGNGLMQPLEQEVARAVSHRRSQGLGPAPVIRKAVTIGAAFSIGVAVVAFFLHGPILDRTLGNDLTLTTAFVVGLVGFGVAHLTRGVLSSHHRFAGYARFFTVDGLGRFALAGALAAVGVGTAGAFGLVLAVTPFLGSLAGLLGQRGLAEPGPEAAWSELTTNLGWLLLGTGCISLIVQGGTIAVGLLASPDEEAAAGVFLNGLQTARIPLFLFQAVLASLLPKLSRLAGVGAQDEFVATLRRLVAAVLGLGAAATLAAAALGPAFISVVFGSTDVLGAVDLALLAAAFVLIMGAICLDQALVALRGHRWMALGWLAAFAAFVAVIAAVRTDLFLRVELGLVAAGVLAFGWMAAALRGRLHHPEAFAAVDEAEALAEIGG